MTLPARLSQRSLPTALTISIIMLLFASGVRAERKTVALGLVGGITGASFWGNEVHSYDVEIWPTTGFTLAFHLPAFIGLETDLLYVSKSGAINHDVFDTSIQANRNKVNTLKLHALEIPFMIKITAPTESEVQPIFFGGPSVAYFFSKKSFSEYIDIANGGTVIPEETPPLIELKNLVDYEWSLCFGMGVEWGLGSFQLRCNFGSETLDKTKAAEVKTFTTAVMAGFIF